MIPEKGRQATEALKVSQEEILRAAEAVLNRLPPPLNFSTLKRGQRLVIQEGPDPEVGEVATITRVEWRGSEPLIQVAGPFGPYWVKLDRVLRRVEAA